MADIADLVHEATSTTGTGALALAVVHGRRRFADVFGTGGTDAFYYFVSHRAAAEWEVGTGHMADANTLSRDTVLASSNSDAAVDFTAGTKDVANDLPAAVQDWLLGSTAAGRSLWAYADPNADRLIFWDDSAGALTSLDLGTGLAIATTTLSPANDLGAIEALSGTGVPKRTGSDAWALGAGVADLAAGTANRLFGTSGAGAAGEVTLPAAGLSLSASALALANDLAALEGLSSTGIAVRTTTDSWAQRSVAVSGAGLSVSNGSGAAGNPTLSLADDAAALEALATTGVARRTGTSTWATDAGVAHLAATTANRLFGSDGAGASGLITLPAAGLSLSAGALALANDLSALEGLSSTGIAVRTTTDSWAQRSVAVSGAGLSVSNGSGVSGNPTLSLADDAAALEALATTGVARRTGTSTWATDAGVAHLAATTANRLFGSDGSGASGLITLPAAGLSLSGGALALANDLAALEGLSSTGLARRTGSDTWDVVPYREVLTGDRFYYVRTDGNDGNSGLANTSGGAFLTLQAAVNAVGALDRGIYTVTINVGSGTFTAGCDINGWGPGREVVRFVGAGSSSTIISATSDNCFFIANAKVHLEAMKLTTTTSGSALGVYSYAQVSWSDVNFGAVAAGSMHIFAQDCRLDASGNYSITGGAAMHIYLRYNATAEVYGRTITLTGTPAFSTRYIDVESGSIMEHGSCTFSGSATGQRYYVAANGVLQVGGAGASYFPGNSAGSTATGGVYS